MKLNQEQLTELLQAQVTKHAESDDFKSFVNDTIKGMIRDMQNDVATPLPKEHVNNLIQTLPEGTKLAGNGRYMQTLKGSIIDLNNQQRPFIQISDEVATWAKAFAKYVKTGVADEKALTSAVDSDGGYLVPDEFRAMMIMYDVVDTAVWSRATVWPMAGTKLDLPKLQQNADSSSENFDHFAGVSFSWVEEGGTKPEAEPEFGLLELIVHELAGYTEITNSLLDDSVINLVNFLVKMFRQAWYWYTDKAFIQGTGGKQPMGIVNDPGVLTQTRDTASSIKAVDAINMWAKLPAIFDAQAVWLVSKTGLAQLRGQTVSDSSDELVLQESYKDFESGFSATILGRPAVLCDGKIPALGSTGDLILGAFPWYYIGFREDFSMDSSSHYKFRNNKTALRCSGRVDGQAAIPEAFVLLSSSTS